MSSEIVILGGARTAMAEYVGTPGFGKFKTLSANDLGARAIEGALPIPTHVREIHVARNGTQTRGIQPLTEGWGCHPVRPGELDLAVPDLGQCREGAIDALGHRVADGIELDAGPIEERVRTESSGEGRSRQGRDERATIHQLSSRTLMLRYQTGSP